MSQQAVMEPQVPAPVQQIEQLTNRMAQVETELATVKAEMQWLLANFRNAAKPTNGYHAPAAPLPGTWVILYRTWLRITAQALNAGEVVA